MTTIPYFEKMSAETFHNKVIQNLIQFGKLSKEDAENQVFQWLKTSIYSPECKTEYGQSIRHFVMKKLEEKVGVDNAHKVLMAN